MRYFIPGLAVAAAALLALPALAQPPEDGEKAGDRPSREQMRERMLKQFDADGDGQLNDEERQKARAAMRERFGRRGPADRDGREGRPRGRDGHGRRDREGGPGHHGGPPMFERLFNRFDEDKSDSLSRDEFKKLAEFVREHRPRGPHRGPGFDGHRPKHPPHPGEDEFRRRPGGPPPHDRHDPDRDQGRDRDADNPPDDALNADPDADSDADSEEPI